MTFGQFQENLRGRSIVIDSPMLIKAASDESLKRLILALRHQHTCLVHGMISEIIKILRGRRDQDGLAKRMA